MTWIKICGITNLEDALMAVEAGADALGFVFYEKSPRKIDPETVQEMVAKLPKNVEKVGVFVDSDANHIRQVASQAGLTAAQLHGKQSMDRVWKDARRIECAGVSKLIPVIPGDALKNGGILINHRFGEKIFAVLLDSRSNGATGGTGTTFDWDGTREMVESLSLLVPVIIAGGLTASNVGDAVRTFHPFGVDVASGVEARPGKKDPEKVRAFVRAAHAEEKRV
ncbi:MAG TPA: phosphoribosylanthranilate isomerase [Terriglobales bacterium]|nr:phosphoribosylanthranilate isomerase [Terriglobales bacterium]